jgi:hypothetical protein
MKSDTEPGIGKIYFDMIMSKSSEQRIKMCLSMNETSRKIVLSTIDDKANWRAIFFEKYYGSDFDEKTKKKIIEAINIK